MLKTKDLYDLTHTRAAELLEKTEYPWEALAKIKEFIIELGKTLPADEYDEVSENVWIGCKDLSQQLDRRTGYHRSRDRSAPRRLHPRQRPGG